MLYRKFLSNCILMFSLLFVAFALTRQCLSLDLEALFPKEVLAHMLESCTDVSLVFDLIESGEFEKLATEEDLMKMHECIIFLGKQARMFYSKKDYAKLSHDLVTLQFDEESCAQLIEELELQLKAQPEDIHTLIHLGVIQSLSDADKGRSLLERAIAIDPTGIAAKFWLATFYYYNFEEAEKAKALLTSILSPDLKSAGYWCLLGRLIDATNGSLQRAIDCTKQAILLAPD